MSERAVAAEKFIEKAGQRDTTVHETIAPAVTQETVVPKRHEEATIAVDKVVHQEHFHTTVLPIEEVEVLEEKQEFVTKDVQHKEHRHGHHEPGAFHHFIEEEKAKFRDFKHEAEATVTQKHAPAVKGERVHHHVHEVIQPIVRKETIVPTVIHTTIPVKEVHHNEAKYHAQTTLPAVPMEEFMKSGGTLGGRPARTETFTGEPRSAGETVSKLAFASSAKAAPSGAAPTSSTGPNSRTNNSPMNSPPTNDAQSKAPTSKNPAYASHNSISWKGQTPRS